jgi:hypothetical protein
MSPVPHQARWPSPKTNKPFRNDPSPEVLERRHSNAAASSIEAVLLKIDR